MKGLHVSFLLRHFFWGIIFFSCVTAFGQNLDGIVFDQASGEPLVGARVIVKGTTIGALTNAEGQFSLRRIPPGAVEVHISYFGYEDIERTLKSWEEQTEGGHDLHHPRYGRGRNYRSTGLQTSRRTISYLLRVLT